MAQEVSAYPECVLTGEPVLSELTVGQICDALDDYGAWHAAIVFEESSNQKHIHFLPFKSNRDEWFEIGEDDHRVAPLLTKSQLEKHQTAAQAVAVLQTYYEANRVKNAQKMSEDKSKSSQQSAKQSAANKKKAPIKANATAA